jgi:hypothetical protein
LLLLLLLLLLLFLSLLDVLVLFVPDFVVIAAAVSFAS